MTRLGPRWAALVTRWHQRHRDERGMTLTELLLASTLLVVLLTLVAVTMTTVTSISGTVTSQFQEYDQALPALAPVQRLLRAEVEPAATNSNGLGGPQPGFAQYQYGSPPTAMSLNFGLQFYANIGTGSYNLTAAGTTAGPAKIVALEVDQSGNPVTSSSHCNPTSPCKFQVRQFLPIVNSGVSTCPVQIDGSAGPCQYPATYTLVTNALDVVNDPSVPNPIFTYSVFDPNWPAGPNSTGTGVLLNATQVQNNLITGLRAAPYNYPTDTQVVTACTASNGSYPTVAIACPLDAVQSVGIDLRVASRGSGTNGTVENQTVVYRYPPTGSGSTTNYPYKFTSGVG